MADKPPDKKPPADRKDGISGCKEKTYSVRRIYRLNVSPARVRAPDGPDCDCMLCERRRERDQRNRARLQSESASTSTESLQNRCERENRRDLRRSLLNSVSGVAGELSQNDSKCQSCPDLIRVTGTVQSATEETRAPSSERVMGYINANAAENGRGDAGDGMEGYFNENRHLLEGSDIQTEDSSSQQRQPAAAIPVETHTYHFPPEVMSRANASAENCDNEDIDEGGVFVCDDDKVAAPVAQTQLEGSSSDDQGDFIEADIPRNSVRGGLYALSSENNTPDSSTDSSYEDLRTMSFERGKQGEGSKRRDRDDDHSYEDLRLLDIKPPNRGAQQKRGSGASGMNALSSENSMSASSTENALSASNVTGAESCRPKTLYGDSLQIEGACGGGGGTESSPVTSVSESSHRTPSSSFLSPQLSDSGATYGIASESSVFLSPDTENFEPLSGGGREGGGGGGGNRGRPPLLRHRSVDCNEHNGNGHCVPPFRAVRSSNDLPSADDFGYRNQGASGGSLDADNIDSNGGSYKPRHVRDKDIDWKASNYDDGTLKSSYHHHHHHHHGRGSSNDARDRSASDASSKKSGRWTHKIVHTGHAYPPNPERYTKPMVCNSVYEAWAETRVRNLFYTDRRDLKDLRRDMKELRGMNSSSSEDDLLASINNLNRHRTESSDYEELLNVSRQTSTSNFDQDENSFQQTDSGSKSDTLKASSSGMSVVTPGNMIDSAGDSHPSHQSEQQENQNNINLETGERYQQAASASADPTSDPSLRGDPDELQKKYNDIKLYLKRKKYKKRTRTVYVKGKPYRHKLIKFKMRQGQIFQALDYDYIHFNYSDSEETSSSSDSDDEGYVDFQVLLRNYMIQRLHERHSVSLLQHQEEVRLAREMEKVMIWSEYEAYMTHIRQIGVSACGHIALINVLRALDLVVEQDKICDYVRSNTRNETGSLTEYILSRAVAGMTAQQLIEATEKLTKGEVSARFFHMYPPRETGCLRKWLANWMKKGAVPVLTLNRQKAVPPGYCMPDAWHHQMVFGAGPKGVYLTNPQEIVPEHVLAAQLCSAGVLKVRRKDIVARWPDSSGGDLSHLLHQPDPRWAAFNVLGQLVHVLREEVAHGGRRHLTPHVTIPACYRSGITLFVRSRTDVHAQLSAARDFPLIKAEEGEGAEAAAAGGVAAEANGEGGGGAAGGGVGGATGGAGAST